MYRRWIIRTPFLLALAFLVTIWMASYSGTIVLDKGSGGRFRGIGVVQGLGFLEEAEFLHPDTRLLLYRDSGGTARERLRVPRTLGFSFDRRPGSPGHAGSFQIVISLWFPILILAAITYFVWRKTRAKLAGRAFPIEPAKEKGHLHGQSKTSATTKTFQA
jgi:hypothetical protein